MGSMLKNFRLDHHTPTEKTTKNKQTKRKHLQIGPKCNKQLKSQNFMTQKTMNLMAEQLQNQSTQLQKHCQRQIQEEKTCSQKSSLQCVAESRVAPLKNCEMKEVENEGNANVTK